jgi:hypothetical protein
MFGSEGGPWREKSERKPEEALSGWLQLVGSLPHADIYMASVCS